MWSPATERLNNATLDSHFTEEDDAMLQEDDDEDEKKKMKGL